MLPVLLITATAAFIPAPPVPPADECEVGLREYCATAKEHGVTECHECVTAHASELEAKHCTAALEAVYCERPLPPAGACLTELEHYCGVDRRSPTACATCIKDHAEILEKANCSAATERTFCEGPPKPPAPSAECERVLEEDCGEDRKNRTLCAECIVRHHNQTVKANCTYTQIEAFCHPVPPPSTDCLRVMFEDCGKVRFNRTECRVCEEKFLPEFKKANCTEVQIEDFCEPPRPPSPPPANATCGRELAELCGREKANRTLCFHCVEEHEKILHNDGCTYKDIDAFCDITPPSTMCPQVLEEYCGADRHNKTACAMCIRRHANETERAHCTATQEEEFCNAAPPVPPEMECRQELEHYCGADRNNSKECVACVEAHASELEKAHCNAAYEHEFCQGPPVPPAPSAKCEAVLTEECGADKANHTLCLGCLARHRNQTKAADCTYTQLEAFCNPTPPTSRCEEALVRYCEADRKNHTKCELCEKEHASELSAEGCTEAQEVAFCAVPEPSDKCFSSLEALCDHERDNRTMCIRCVDEHKPVLDGRNCTTRDIDLFCHITPPSPEPSSCFEELDKYCGVDRHNKTLCHSCEERHENYTKACTAEDKIKFCNSTVPPTPVTQCTRVLDSYCGLDRSNHTKCLVCTADHEAQEKAAGCTIEEVTRFCENIPPAPPNPVNRCTSALKEYCGVDVDKEACIRCTVAHASQLKAATCTESEEVRFCNSTVPVPGFWF